MGQSIVLIGTLDKKGKGFFCAKKLAQKTNRWVISIDMGTGFLVFPTPRIEKECN